MHPTFSTFKDKNKLRQSNKIFITMFVNQAKWSQTG